MKAVVLVLDEALLVGVVLVVLWQLGVDLSPGVVIAVVVVLAIWILVLYRIILSLVRRKQVGGREGMIGLQAKVVTPLNPEGLVKVRGELWKASCADGSIGSQEEVIVVRIDGLRLLVERKK
ncbi:MAG: hypothetical protein ISS53_00670 [Dehalococcoidia bacterium]|nr:hypothetical protein [Dehalococcoidia bacterium]